MIPLDRYPRRAPNVLNQRADDEIILFNLEHGNYYSLTEVGIRIWDLCDGSRQVSEIAAVISNEYDVPIDEARTDVLELLAELAEEKLTL
jgi:hypothetical protein